MGNTERRVLAGVLAGASATLVPAGCGLDLDPQETRTDGGPIGQPITSVRFDVPAADVRLRVQDGAPVSLRRTVTYEGRSPGKSHRVDGQTLMLRGCGDDCAVEYDVVGPRDMAAGPMP